MLVVNIDGILDRMPVCGALVINRERSPPDHLPIRFGDNHRMFFSVRFEPVAAAFNRLRLLLVGAGGLQDVMIVNVINRGQIGFSGWPDAARNFHAAHCFLKAATRARMLLWCVKLSRASPVAECWRATRPESRRVNRPAW